MYHSKLSVKFHSKCVCGLSFKMCVDCIIQIVCYIQVCDIHMCVVRNWGEGYVVCVGVSVCVIVRGVRTVGGVAVVTEDRGWVMDM